MLYRGERGRGTMHHEVLSTNSTVVPLLFADLLTCLCFTTFVVEQNHKHVSEINFTTIQRSNVKNTKVSFYYTHNTRKLVFYKKLSDLY